MASFKKIKKKIKRNLTEGITVILSPHSSGKQVSFKIPKLIVIMCLFFLVGYLGYSTRLLTTHLRQYRESLPAIEQIDDVLMANEYLRMELITLAAETEELRNSLLALHRKGELIQSLLSDDLPVTAERNIDIACLNTLFDFKTLTIETGGFGGRGDIYLKQDAFSLIQSMHQDLKELREIIPFQEEDLAEFVDTAREYSAIIAATPAILPLADDGTAYISSSFGLRQDPFTGKQAFHEGIDIAVKTGTPVFAAAYGEVVFAGWQTGYGYTVVINHGYGFETLYAHNSRVEIQKGEKVNRGQVIAYSGNTGRSTAPHLHYEVRVNGVPKNPLKFINSN